MSKSQYVLVSVASQGRENYNKAQLNLIKSADESKNVTRNWYGDYLMRSVDGYTDEYRGVRIHLGQWPQTEKYGASWQHKDMPYQFKPFAIWEAIEAGYTKILWCDSTIRIMKNPEPLWEKCAEQGILAWDNLGHELMDYTPDFMLTWLEENGHKAGGKQIMACCIMFDTTNPKTLPVIEAWIKGSLENCFHHNTSTRPNFKGARHDQALLSHLLHDAGIEVQDYGQLAYRHHQPIEPTYLNWGVND